MNTIKHILGSRFFSRLSFLIVNKSETYISTSQKKQDFINEFFEQFKAELTYAYVQHRDIAQSEEDLVFEAPLFRHMWNGWNIFNPVMRGELHFQTVSNLIRLEVRLFFSEFFLTAFLLSFAAVPAFVLGAYGAAALWLLGLWLVFYGGARLINHLRMKSKIKDLIRKTERIQKQERTLKDVWEEDKGFINEVFGHFFTKKSTKK